MGLWFFSGKGDEGKTNLFDGSMVKKNDPILEVIGSMDELTAFIGLAISFCDQTVITGDLRKTQDILSKMMGIAAGAGSIVTNSETFLSGTLTWMEKRIHYYGEMLDNPQGFIYSGSTDLGAALDVARTVTRRAERAAVGILSDGEKLPVLWISVINRLSSLFYVMRLYVDNQK